MAVIDIFTYNGEKDILRLHLSVLGPHVDKFIICEAKTTFSGLPKPLYFFRDQRYFKPWWHMIDYYVIDENYTQEEIDLANSSPNTKGAEHWKREFLQKESLKKALAAQNLQDSDRVYIGDVDEIWDPAFNVGIPNLKLKLKVYSYYLNNRSNEEFWGTLATTYGDIKDECLNHLRTKAFKTIADGGWHFTSMGGLKEVQRKLNDSYTIESYNLNYIPGWVESCVAERKDLLNRGFTYTIDESEWPQFLKDNRKKYAHLCL
jgi:beta-1,4-mannosyl-glycoprotein beta-1,4-N-acetylglucosaminyltransferase